MGDKLKELTDKLYEEGVEKAKIEARSIIEDAERKKQELIGTAREEAADIIKTARGDAEAEESKIKAELAIACRQALATVKQAIAGVLTESVLNDQIQAAAGDRKFLIGLIDAVTRAWAENDGTPDPRVIISESGGREFREGLSAAIKDRLDNGVSLEASGKIKGGFRVESRDGRYALSFTTEDFQEYFRGFIKESTRGLLFGDS